MLTLSSIKNRATLAPFQTSKAVVAATFLLMLSACGSDNDNDNDNANANANANAIESEILPPLEYSYSVTVTNLTYAQPLSPVAVVLHNDSKMWMTGEPSSQALEKLAESGDNNEFISDSSALASVSGEGVVMPGSAATITVNTTDRNAAFFTAATMLVNTNDAFAGLTGIDISTMAIDDIKSWNLNVYDSGTEANDEAMGTIPGPADGGTGYDEARNDVDFVALHSGVVSQDDGLSSSVITQAHRFDNPAIKLTITRTK
jgi:hypothetical protein